MKILHISRTMGQGGAEKVVYQICKEPNNNVMFVASTGGFYEKDLNNLGIKHFNIPDINKKNPIIILKIFFLLCNIIKEEEIDIIHSHHRMAAFYSKLISLFNKKVRRVYTAHNVFYNKKKLLKYALKGSKIIAVGDGVKNNLVNYFEIKDDIQVIYNSIEKKERLEIPKEEFFKNRTDKILIGTIGRITEQKGMDIFIKALEPLIKTNSNIYGVIIGDGEDREVLEQMSADLNIGDNIMFLGYRNDVFDVANQMDFIVLSSRWEGFPLTPIEMFSIGKTVIASNIDGNNEIVVDNYNGILFEKDNIRELTSRIQNLISNKEKRIVLEKNALNTYMQRFEYKVFIQAYQKAYKDIME